MKEQQALLHTVIGVQEEQQRLQMVAEMSKRLGTNVSKFELESLRAQAVT